MVRNARAVFFDAGFTLVEPLEPIEHVYFSIASKFDSRLCERDFVARMRQLWHDPDRRRKLLGDGLECSDAIERDSWHRFTREVAVAFPTLLVHHEEWLRSLIEHFDQPGSWRAIEHASEVLQELRSRGKRLAILTNWHSAFHVLARAHGIDKQVDLILTSAEVGYRKPHGEIFRRALHGTNVRAENAVHIGDSLKEDVLGAHEAGIAAFHFVREASQVGEVSPRRISSLRQLLES